MGPSETRNLLGDLYWLDSNNEPHSISGLPTINFGYYMDMPDKEAEEKKEKEMREQFDRLKKELDKTKKQKKTFAEKPFQIPSEPEKIIKNGPVVIVFWKDKTKTIVRKKPDDPDDIYSAVAQAMMKKWCGSTSHAHKYIDKILVKNEVSK